MPFFISSEMNPEGYSDTTDLRDAISASLQDIGTASGDAPFVEIDSDSTSIILEARGVDPIWAMTGNSPSGFTGNQNWRIALSIDNSDHLNILWGTENQMPNVAGIDVDTPSTQLVDSTAIGTQGASFPRDKFIWHYILSTTDRGFALVVYAAGQENQMINPTNGKFNSKMICIQRPSNSVNGAIKDTPRAPVFAVFNDLVLSQNINSWAEDKETNNGFIPGFKFSVVRDDDTPFSSDGVAMNLLSESVRYTFDLEWHQPTSFANYTQMIKFPLGLSTIRHIYLEKMDIMGLVYAGTMTTGQAATIDLYTPIQTRTYTAGPGHVGAVPLFIATGTGTQPTNKYKDTDFWSRIVLMSDGDAVNVLNSH